MAFIAHRASSPAADPGATPVPRSPPVRGSPQHTYRIVVYEADSELTDTGVTSVEIPAARYVAWSMTPQDAVRIWADQLEAEEQSLWGSSRAIVRSSSEFSLRSESSRACCTAATATRWARPTRAWLGSDSGSTRYASNRGVSPLQGTLGVVGVIAFYLAANIPHLSVAIGVIFGLL